MIKKNKQIYAYLLLIHNGEIDISLINAIHEAINNCGLTFEQNKVLNLISKGYLLNEIALNLNISSQGVSKHYDLACNKIFKHIGSKN